MSKYTPGPWKAETYGTKTTIEIKSLVVEDVPAVVSWQGFDDCFRPRKEHLKKQALAMAAIVLKSNL